MNRFTPPVTRDAGNRRRQTRHGRRPAPRALSPALLACCLGLALVIHAPAAAAEPFQFQDGDRVVLVGSAVLERDYTYGHLETALTLAAGDTQVTFRNLAWSGDTVFGHARSYFGPPAEGLDRLGELIEALEPTVVVLCYGIELAHEKDNGAAMEAFLDGYGQLIERILRHSDPREIIVLSPPPLEDLGAPLPSQQEANQRLAGVSEALAGFSREVDARHVDWFALMGGGSGLPEQPGPLTNNGIHYHADGYRVLAAKLLQGLGLGAPATTASPVAEAVREAVLAKNELFFHRWRPANETYLHGFRKHEQGQNAAELLEFEPMVAAKDEVIHELKTQGTN